MSTTQWSDWVKHPSNSSHYRYRYVNGQLEYDTNYTAQSSNPWQQQNNPWANPSQGLPQGSDSSSTIGSIGQNNPGSPQPYPGTNNPYRNNWPNQSPINNSGGYNPYRNNGASSAQPAYSQYGGYGGGQSLDMSSLNADLPDVKSMPTADEFKTQYKVISLKDQRHFYKPGRVFKTFTFQSKGQQWETSFTVEQLRGQYFAEVRYYIILKSLKTYSVCLPIHTYQGKGTLASHAKASHHVQVYTGSRPPSLLPRERLTRDPIQVIVKSKKMSLDKASRLNLSKPQSIEHNLPVAEVGKVSKEDLNKITNFTLEYLKSGISEGEDSSSRAQDDDSGENEDDDDEEDDDDDEEEDKKEEAEESDDDEEDDKVPDNLNRRWDRNPQGNYLPPRQNQNPYWPDRLPVRPQTTIGIRQSHSSQRRRR